MLCLSVWIWLSLLGSCLCNPFTQDVGESNCFLYFINFPPRIPECALAKWIQWRTWISLFVGSSWSSTVKGNMNYDWSDGFYFAFTAAATHDADGGRGDGDDEDGDGNVDGGGGDDDDDDDVNGGGCVISCYSAAVAGGDFNSSWHPLAINLAPYLSLYLAKVLSLAVCSFSLFSLCQHLHCQVQVANPFTWDEEEEKFYSFFLLFFSAPFYLHLPSPVTVDVFNISSSLMSTSKINFNSQVSPLFSPFLFALHFLSCSILLPLCLSLALCVLFYFKATLCTADTTVLSHNSIPSHANYVIIKGA